MHLLYPCDPFDRKKPDEVYEEEFSAAQRAGFTCFLFSLEDFELGEFKPRPANQFEGEILYRGWMLTPTRYAQLQEAIELKGATVVVTAKDYQRCHYLPEWYDQCQDITPRTLFLTKGDDFLSLLSKTGWSTYFVKDFVKSLTSTRSSIARNAAEVQEIIKLIEHYRGQLEGGVCIREFEDLLPETEERYFVFHGKPFARNSVVPDLVLDIARRIESPFFSVDLALDKEGILRLIELGDGQVSDRKKWPVSTFIEIFN